jgi:hypothetical protein
MIKTAFGVKVSFPRDAAVGKLAEIDRTFRYTFGDLEAAVPVWLAVDVESPFVSAEFKYLWEGGGYQFR